MFARRVYYDPVFQEDQPLQQQPIYNCLLYDYRTDPSQLAANGAPHQQQSFLVPSPDMSYGYAGEADHFARWRNPEVLPTIVEARSISVEEYDQMCTCVKNHPVCDVNQGAVVQGEFAFIAHGASRWGYGDAYGRPSSHFLNGGTAKGLIPELLFRPPQVVAHQGRSNQFAAVEDRPPTVHVRSHDELACQAFKSHLPCDTHNGFRHTGVRKYAGSVIEHGDSIEARDKEASARNAKAAVKVPNLSTHDTHNGFRHTEPGKNVGSVIEHRDSIETTYKEASAAVKASHMSTKRVSSEGQSQACSGKSNLSRKRKVLEFWASAEKEVREKIESMCSSPDPPKGEQSVQQPQATARDRQDYRKQKVLKFWEITEKEVRDKIEKICSSPVPQKGEHGFRASEETPPCTKSVQQPQATTQDRQDYVTRDVRQDGDNRHDVRQDGDVRHDVRQDGDVVYVKQVPKKRLKLDDIVMRLKGSSS